MKKLIVVLLFFRVATLYAEKISLVGTTVSNPADGKVLPTATIVINGDKIEEAGLTPMQILRIRYRQRHQEWRNLSGELNLALNPLLKR